MLATGRRSTRNRPTLKRHGSAGGRHPVSRKLHRAIPAHDVAPVDFVKAAKPVAAAVSGSMKSTGLAGRHLGLRQVPLALPLAAVLPVGLLRMKQGAEVDEASGFVLALTVLAGIIAAGCIAHVPRLSPAGKAARRRLLATRHAPQPGTPANAVAVGGQEWMPEPMRPFAVALAVHVGSDGDLSDGDGDGDGGCGGCGD